jgi:nucleotide-binding universal stress UspA family protein
MAERAPVLPAGRLPSYNQPDMTARRRRLLVAIDDTDNHESRGTGHRARGIGRMLAHDGLAVVHGISRHQLYVHPDIPYTSHNSSLCLDLDWLGGDLEELAQIVRAFLVEHAAPGSDAAYAIARFDDIGESVMEFGRRAKDTVLTQADARALAAREGLILEGVTGTEGGVIGSLAGVGLRRTGRDGRFVWVEGVRELTGVVSIETLLGETGIHVVRSPSGERPGPGARIAVDPWPRPVLIDHQAVLLIEKAEKTNGTCDWQLVPRELTKQY